MKVNMNDLQVGDEVHYQPSHYPDNRWENGLVKEVPKDMPSSVRVVYNCGGRWHRFKEYTSSLTNIRDLKPGWKY